MRVVEILYTRRQKTHECLIKSNKYIAIHCYLLFDGVYMLQYSITSCNHLAFLFTEAKATTSCLVCTQMSSLFKLILLNRIVKRLIHKLGG